VSAAPVIESSEASLDHEVVIVGTGFAGIGTAIELKRVGIHDFTVFEKADDLGGTWRDNTYPGLAVDVPSLSYSFGFEMNPDWSRLYAPGGELKQYADHCVDKYGVRAHIEFGKGVDDASWDEEGNAWALRLDDGTIRRTRYLVSATGLLIVPKLPDIKGVESYRGKLMHSARWDHDYDLTGKRVAVIGTGGTAIQLIPTIVDQVAQLDVYQRTPIWLMPKPDLEISEGWKRAFRRIPLLQRFLRLLTALIGDVFLGIGLLHHKQFPWLFGWIERKCEAFIRSEVDDSELAEKLIPKYSFFCKRPSFSNTYFSTFNREDVELVTDPIDRVTENGIVTRDGTLREVDVIVCATGYSYFDRESPPTFPVAGRGGRVLGDFWHENRFQAFQGSTIPDFPNFFLMLGPYSTAGVSYFNMINTQGHHLSRVLREARKRGANYVEVKQASLEADFEKTLRRSENTVYRSGDCALSNSYYFDEHGDAPGLRPMSYIGHWLQSRTFSMRHYDFASKGS